MITAKADHQKRILVPQAKPGEVYSIRENVDGSITLISINQSEPAAPTCNLSTENGLTVVVPRQPINENAIKELLAEFP